MPAEHDFPFSSWQFGLTSMAPTDSGKSLDPHISLAIRFDAV